jgi:uncharacterized protein YggE
MKPVLASLALLVCAGFASANITVVGNGKITYTPDVGYLGAGVTSEAKTAAEAWEKNGEIVRKLFDVLKANGIDPKDMKTAGLSVNPKYFYPKNEEPRLVGYTATYDLSVTVRKLDDLGRVVDELVANGANQHMGISFGCSDPEKFMDEARVKAVADARKKAEIYANGAGCGLGLVQSISEGSNYAPVRYEFERALAAKDAPLPIAAGQQDMNVQVTVVFAVTHSAGSPK